MSHNLIAWSFPLDMKLRPSPWLSICVIPCKCPVKTPAACPVDKQRLSQTCILLRSHTIALQKCTELRTSNVSNVFITFQLKLKILSNPDGLKHNLLKIQKVENRIAGQTKQLSPLHHLNQWFLNFFSSNLLNLTSYYFNYNNVSVCVCMLGGRGARRWKFHWLTKIKRWTWHVWM